MRERNTANSVESGVVNFDFALEESLNFLCKLGMSRELQTGQKDTIASLVLALGKV